MNIYCFIGNLKAGTSCLGVKCCPLISHLDTVKGGGAHAMWAGLGARTICCADKRHAAHVQAWNDHPVPG